MIVIITAALTAAGRVLPHVGVVERHFLDLMEMAQLEAAGKEKVSRNLVGKVLNILPSTVWRYFVIW